MKTIMLLIMITVAVMADTKCELYTDKLTKYMEQHKTEIRNGQKYRVATMKHYAKQRNTACKIK